MLLITKDKNFVLPKKTLKSVIYPSQIPIAHKCMGSVLLFEETEPHPVAEIGKKAHEDIEKCIEKAFKTKKRVWSGFVLEGADTLINDYLKYVYDNKKGTSHFGVECVVYDRFYNYLVSGVCDFFFVRDGKLTVVDFKTGYGKMNDLHWAQLWFYALCLGIQLELPEDDEIDLVFYTRFGVLERKKTMKELLLFKNEVCRKMRDFKFEVGEHCVSCYSFHRCEYAQRKAEKVVQVMSERPANEIEKFFKFRKFIEKYFETLEKSIIEKYDGKKDTGNFRIYETPGRKFWKHDKLRELRSKQGMLEPKLLTVAEAMKRGFDVEGYYDLVKTKKAVMKK